MKASVILAVSGAVMAVAGPVAKRDIKIDYTTEVVYVTVTEGEPAPTSHSMFGAGAHVHPTTTSTSTPKKTTTPPPPPPPKPTTKSPVAAPVVTTIVEQPKPSVASTPKQASSPAANDAPAQPSDFSSTVLYHHNIHRQNHSAPAMSYSDTYASYAAQTAKSCHFAHDLTPGGGGYGQNIAMYAATGDVEGIGASKIIAQATTDMWYNGEVWQFPSSGFGQGTPDMSGFENWGHWSQVVWIGSTQVGCAAQYCPPGTMYSDMGAWFSVCDYHPAGNVGGGYGNNLKAGEGQPTINA